MVINNNDSFLNTINDYELSMTLLHETFHCFSNYCYSTGLNEAVVEVMANEYNGELKLNKCTYQDEIICFYALSEIIGIEPFKNLTLKGDSNSITNELNNIIPNRNLANQLIENIDNLSDLKNQNNLEEYESTKIVIYEIIKQYYEAKYDSDIEQDEIMMTYFSYGKFISNDMNGYRYIYDIYPKGLFSNEYIVENQDIIYITVDIEETITYAEASQRKLISYKEDNISSNLPKDGDIRLVFDDEEDKIYIVRLCQNVMETETKNKTFELHKFF